MREGLRIWRQLQIEPAVAQAHRRDPGCLRCRPPSRRTCQQVSIIMSPPGRGRYRKSAHPTRPSAVGGKFQATWRSAFLRRVNHCAEPLSRGRPVHRRSASLGNQKCQSTPSSERNPAAARPGSRCSARRASAAPRRPLARSRYVERRASRIAVASSLCAAARVSRLKIEKGPAISGTCRLKRQKPKAGHRGGVSVTPGLFVRLLIAPGWVVPIERHEGWHQASRSHRAAFAVQARSSARAMAADQSAVTDPWCLKQSAAPP